MRIIWNKVNIILLRAFMRHSKNQIFMANYLKLDPETEKCIIVHFTVTKEKNALWSEY